MRRGLALLIVLAAVSTACVSGTAGTTTTSTTDGGPTSTAAEPGTTSTLPEAGLEAALDWIVEVLNGAQLATDEYESRFSNEFRQAVPYEDFQAVLTQLRQGAPYVIVESMIEGSSGEAIIQPVDDGDARLRLIAAVEEDGRFGTLLFQPVDGPELADLPETLEDAFSRLSELGELRALAAEIVGGECMTIRSSQADRPAPIGSVFKLYVLAAIGEAIDREELSWDDQLEIDDGLKSIPTGVLQDRSAGSLVTIEEAAELMISISDNTAADHLIDLVGREDVEETMVDYGNTTPELNTPLLTTREFAALKVGPASGLKTQWVEAGAEERLDILDQISGITPGDIPVREWSDPVLPDQIEWFATPDDLCTLAIRMADLAGRVPEIADILEINPGVPGADTWDQIWFKGGSEPGLLAMWFRTELNERTFFIAGSVVDPESTLDQTEAALLFGAARDLLAP